jgi:hypothetical protein
VFHRYNSNKFAVNIHFYTVISKYFQCDSFDIKANLWNVYFVSLLKNLNLHFLIFGIFSFLSTWKRGNNAWKWKHNVKMSTNLFTDAHIGECMANFCNSKSELPHCNQKQADTNLKIVLLCYYLICSLFNKITLF